MFNVYKSNDERLRYNQLKVHPNFFKLINSKSVQCICGKQVKLDKTYRVKNLETHASGSGCSFQNGTSKGQPSILNFVKKHSLEFDEDTPVQKSYVSCQGLNGDKYLDYILLTPTQYGGGKRDYIVAYNLFPDKFPRRKGFSRNRLTIEEKKILQRELLSTYKWRIDKDLKAIYSMSCERKTQHPSGICISCQAIRDNTRFRDALNEKRNDDTTAKFIPNHYEFTKTLQNVNLKRLYRVSVDDQEAKIWLELAELGQKGAFNSNKTFTELAALMIKIKNLEERGKKKNGLRYSEHLLYFFSLLSESSRTYSIFKNAFGGMSLQHIRRQRAKDQDVFTNPELSFENIVQFAKVASDYHWKGPVILMTDCTKLRPKVVYSQEFGAIMGSVLPSNQTKVSTYEDIHATMKLIRENNAVANQIRGFILKIPISKISPVMIAAIPTKGDVSATEISQLLLDIINMTAHAGINLLSIGADGAIAEMKAQEKIINNESIEKYLEFEDSFYGINFRAPIYNNRPIIRVQCPKHAKKTARNQIHYGSKLLAFENDTIRYDQLLELAQFPNSPICVRDVCNVDKQDDAAAY
ncbi:uncharacterized protein OCT59_008720 [Rhizophagus irregularis]|uniref:uncharacterized protein n=1 Tax=Rhizophagus irregularis TaxID=588596 RepID=UPI0019FE3732|nr:hypothetical protein OCT59_008720 [Rhizophagus irregularis]GBC29582.2 hypothetical protein RIR_jg22184.t1 [Rhizophagus irregularis DAOM 181602=DAOM 197198]